MKKIISLLLCVVMLFACVSTLASCDKAEYTIGIIQLMQHDALDAATAGFKDALIEEFGEGAVKFYEGNANGDSTACTTIANDHVSKNVDLIMANATPALLAAAAATESIPILGTSVTDYNDAFKNNISKNVSGTSDLVSVAQQVDLLLDLYPDAKNQKIGMLFCSAESNSRYQIDAVKAELINRGFNADNIKEHSYADSNEVAGVAQAAAAASDLIYIPTDNMAASYVETINGAIGNTPVIAAEEGICKGCGVATLGISYYELGKMTGKMAAKILKGETKIGDMPIEFATPVRKYNKTKCQQLNINTDELDAKGYVAIG